MYTEKQAKEAIYQKWLKDFETKIRLMWHESAIKEQEVYGLPYKIIFDYYKADRDFMEVPLNPYYPLPDIPKEYKPPKWDPEANGGYTLEEWYQLTSKPTGEITEDGRTKVEFEIPEDIQAKIKDWQAEKIRERMGHDYKHLWDLSTPEGLKAWLYWFGVFLVPYADDIPHWNGFNMFGDTTHTEQELEDRKRYYMDLIEQCKAGPDIYKHEIQRKDITDYEKYDLERAYMWRNSLNPEAPQGDNALKIMYYERERLKRFWGKEYNLQANYEPYSECYKVEKIIKELEIDQDIHNNFLAP